MPTLSWLGFRYVMYMYVTYMYMYVTYMYMYVMYMYMYVMYMYMYIVSLCPAARVSKILQGFYYLVCCYSRIMIAYTYKFQNRV